MWTCPGPSEASVTSPVPALVTARLPAHPAAVAKLRGCVSAGSPQRLRLLGRERGQQGYGRWHRVLPSRLPPASFRSDPPQGWSAGAEWELGHRLMAVKASNEPGSFWRTSSITVRSPRRKANALNHGAVAELCSFLSATENVAYRTWKPDSAFLLSTEAELNPLQTTRF